eukprot:13271378-Alexandrium_andersonii.AAC.1
MHWCARVRLHPDHLHRRLHDERGAAAGILAARPLLPEAVEEEEAEARRLPHERARIRDARCGVRAGRTAGVSATGPPGQSFPWGRLRPHEASAGKG